MKLTKEQQIIDTEQMLDIIEDELLKIRCWNDHVGDQIKQSHIGRQTRLRVKLAKLVG
ncbi:hypothetical protein [Celeribacter sp.]|uniref:hypothetical protein n=1 Tax=Celeribacter sp. TaxID=1890673 RepID=UPI003A941A0D